MLNGDADPPGIHIMPESQQPVILPRPGGGARHNTPSASLTEAKRTRRKTAARQIAKSQYIGDLLHQTCIIPKY